MFGLAAADWSGSALPADAAGRNGFTNNVDRLIVDDDYGHPLYKSAETVASVVAGRAFASSTATSRSRPCRR